MWTFTPLPDFVEDFNQVQLSEDLINFSVNREQVVYASARSISLGIWNSTATTVSLYCPRIKVGA
jgi:hypothetical protein